MDDLVKRLQNPPRMSVAANSGHLAVLLYDLIAASADEIERLNVALDDHYNSAWDKIALLTKSLGEMTKERDDLRLELQNVLADWNEMVKASGSPTNGSAIGHVAALRKEVEALRVDAGRLDWMESNADDWPYMHDDGDWVRYYLAGPEGGDKGAGGCESRHADLREAIDAAMNGKGAA